MTEHVGLRPVRWSESTLYVDRTSRLHDAYETRINRCVVVVAAAAADSHEIGRKTA